LAVPVLALTACGDDGDTGPSSAANAGSSAPDTRTYTGPLGTVTVPGDPERIVALDPMTTQILVALGEPPAGAFLGGDDFDPLLEGRTEGIEPVGKAEIDLERVAAVKPDLLVGFDYIEEDKAYSRLKSFAPLAALSFDPQEWESWTKQAAKAVGAEDAAAEIIADYEAKVAALKPKVEGQTVSIIEPTEDGKIWWYGPPYGGGRVLTDLGVDVQPIPEGTELFGTPEVLGEISQERVGELTGDTLIVHTRRIGRQKTEALLESPVFQDVKAVRNGNVEFIDGQRWVDIGPLSYSEVLAEAEQALAR
jgi:iron complex transport system substrate-binding protein